MKREKSEKIENDDSQVLTNVKTCPAPLNSLKKRLTMCRVMKLLH